MKQIVIYTDGGAEPNPGPGGWGAVLIDPKSGAKREIFGGAERTTNNRMELTAAMEALRSLEGRHHVELVTDSTYLKNGVTQWMKGWIARGWQRREGKLANVDLWKELADLVSLHDIDWRWVKGHSGREHNERADELATRGIRRVQTEVVPPPRVATDAEVFVRVATPRGRGGWAVLLRCRGEESVLTGTVPGATANQLEIHAAAVGLEAVPAGRSAAVYSTSDYLRHGASQWIHGWRKRGWRTKAGKSVKNRDRWLRLQSAMEVRRVEWPAPAEAERAELERLEGRARDAAR